MSYNVIDTQSLSEAIALAAKAHDSQVDKNGHPYILHPLRVMTDVYRVGADPSTVRAAVLHDVVEDTDVSRVEILDAFGDRTALLVDCVSHVQGETYREFIERVAKNENATLIKLADIRDNMDPARITRNAGLYKRYAKAYYRLTYGVWPS